MLKTIVIILLLIVPAFIEWSCSCADAVLKKYQGISISLGTAGGITGTTQGFRMDTEGKVYSFNGRLDRRDENVLFVASKDSVCRFYQRIEDMKFREIGFDSTGNVNCFVELRSNTLIHRIRWVPSDTTAPASVRSLYTDMMKYIEDQTTAHKP